MKLNSATKGHGQNQLQPVSDECTFVHNVCVATPSPSSYATYAGSVELQFALTNHWMRKMSDMMKNSQGSRDEVRKMFY